MAAVERLGAHSDRLGNLALVEQDAAASVWCIDVAFLVDRYIHRDAFGDLPRRLLMGTVLDIHPDAEIEVRTMTDRSEEHTSELQSLMRISYAVFCLKKKKNKKTTKYNETIAMLT